MAHPDLVMRFSKEGFAPDFDPAPFWQQMAECAHDTGRRVEVSTAAPRKGLDDYYPATGLLRCFAHAEVPITFGSDAHRACDICWNIREAQAHAYDCGYRTFDIPHATGEWNPRPSPSHPFISCGEIGIVLLDEALKQSLFHRNFHDPVTPTKTVPND